MQCKKLIPKECKNNSCLCKKCIQQHIICVEECMDEPRELDHKITFREYCLKCIEVQNENHDVFHPVDDFCNYFEDWIRRVVHASQRSNSDRM